MRSSHRASSRNRAPAWALLATLWVVPQVGSAHIDGFGTIPGFTAPYGIVSPESDRIEYQWNDDENEPTATFKFYYKVGNGLPVDVPPQSQREGTLIGEMAVESETDQLSWDTSGLDTGAYTLFSETNDPPLCEVTEFLPALIVIQRAGDAMPLGGLFTDPPPAGSVADRAVHIGLEIVSPTAPRITLRAGHAEEDPEADTPFSLCYEERQKLVYDFDLLTSHALTAHPTITERWVLDWVWESSAVPDGIYILEATVSTDAESDPFKVFANGAVSIMHLGSGGSEPSANHEGGCQSTPGAMSWWWLFLGAGLLVRRQRVPYTQA